MPKIVDHDEVRSNIRRAAWRAFSERGVKGTGLGHVSAAAGVGRSSLYHYYPSKGSLISDMTEELLSSEERTFLDVTSGEGSPTDRISALVERLLDGFSAWSSIDAAMFDLRGIQSVRFRKFYKNVRTHLAQLIRQGQKLGEFDETLNAEQLSACIVGLVDGLLLQFIADGESLKKMQGWQETTKQSVAKMLGQ